MTRWHLGLILFSTAVFTGNASGEGKVDMDKGRQMFLQGTKPSCALCHTLQDAGAAGEIGPNLDELKPDAERVAKAIRQGVGIMPAFPDLSDAEVSLLAAYVAAAAK